MKVVKEAISSPYLEYGIDEDIVIHEGNFCIYLDKLYKCKGRIYYRISPPVCINFEAKVLGHKNIDLEILKDDYLEGIIEVHGYQPFQVNINNIQKNYVDGYVSSGIIKSKNRYVDYIDFHIVNFDKKQGTLIKYMDKLFAGRIEFEISGYEIIIDKRYDYKKELYEELRFKNGSIITHIGRIKRKDNKVFKSTYIFKLLDEISDTLSFLAGRYIGICMVMGYKDNQNTFRLWKESLTTPFKYVPTWSDTIANHHNIEKYMNLMCRKLHDSYYGPALKHVVDWYIESIDNISIENNVVSLQIALETLSYVVVVEKNKILTDVEFEKNTASDNIRILLDACSIYYGKEELNLFNEYIYNKFNDGVDIFTYFRNKVVHPTRKTKRANLTVEDMWNILQIGTRYVELVVLYIINYKGEYSNRLNDRCYGEVEVVPWND
ncbi:MULTISPECIES: hypothetical protein [Paraclostridium]|uniref:YopA central domain-containing protein n=1 Tax=Paraclostridium bifermentans TaxID=1490 RepID=A0AA44DJ30_PARBF|nr:MULTISPECIES: hypothetical protein [Paraclostridium]MDV8113767.1 hypothetical protein [Bacillus sp. BAU-SS-2023]EQK39162.1 hypothetical protein C671_3242 [[Clostridium] bifermentans ATCC 19299] [Paraclostridium bifermentans ATCC 19299]MBN8047659.1 hypothetical protein [Paraclostridium bifermentans]MBZ6006785.1 hypothetical protein [Paraclostridium bifermentans]MCR1875736.1 hypothetical protein [Paraclostridium bifermentans]